MSTRPLVWVVTPVYNGERYLHECIESVLAQTYENWKYVIFDNCSTDRTVEIASGYAARDMRVHLRQGTRFRPIIQNWNAALGLIPDDARYCKVVHADDTLFLDCIERMVDLAERHPSVAVVTSYALWGDDVRHLGVPHPVEFVDGREICRDTLLGKCYVFGSPTSTLLRASDVRAREAFYDEEDIHADTDACFELLMDGDLGFVHQVLTRTRVHPDAMTSLSARLTTSHGSWLVMHIRYGPLCLPMREYYWILARRLRRYVVFLAKAVVRAKYRDPRFRNHHRMAVARVLRLLASSGFGRPERVRAASRQTRTGSRSAGGKRADER